MDCNDCPSVLNAAERLRWATLGDVLFEHRTRSEAVEFSELNSRMLWRCRQCSCSGRRLVAVGVRVSW